MIVPGADATPLSVNELEAYARAYLPKQALDYYASGADDMGNTYMVGYSFAS
jgi:hypothetical protein